jgi:quinol monooxygenase YgiN
MAASSDLIIIARAKARPGHERDLAAALREVAAPTRAQAGSVAFSLYQSADDPSVVVGFERWTSAADHDRHLQGAHVERLMRAMAHILVEPPTIVSYKVLDER